MSGCLDLVHLLHLQLVHLRFKLFDLSPFLNLLLRLQVTNHIGLFLCLSLQSQGTLLASLSVTANGVE